MKYVPEWLRIGLIAILLCAAALLLLEMYVQAKAGGSISKGWSSWVVQIQDVRTITYTILGVIMTVIAQRVRLPF